MKLCCFISHRQIMPMISLELLIPLFKMTTQSAGSNCLPHNSVITVEYSSSFSLLIFDMDFLRCLLSSGLLNPLNDLNRDGLWHERLASIS